MSKHYRITLFNASAKLNGSDFICFECENLIIKGMEHINEHGEVYCPKCNAKRIELEKRNAEAENQLLEWLFETDSEDGLADIIHKILTSMNRALVKFAETGLKSINELKASTNTERSVNILDYVRQVNALCIKAKSTSKPISPDDKKELLGLIKDMADHMSIANNHAVSANKYKENYDLIIGNYKQLCLALGRINIALKEAQLSTPEIRDKDNNILVEKRDF